MDWFRSHHGAPSDSKWLVIARKAKVQPVAVVAVFWSLLDYASQQESRGDIEGFDPESVAAFLGIEDDEITAIMIAFEDKGITTEGRIANWDKRQPKREREDDLSTARSQKFRAKKASAEQATPETPATDNATPCNAKKRQETPRLDKRREEENRTTADAVAREASAVVPVESLPATPDAPMQGSTYPPSRILPVYIQDFIAAKGAESKRWERELRLEIALVAIQGDPARYMASILKRWEREGLPQRTAAASPSGPVSDPNAEYRRMRREIAQRNREAQQAQELHQSQASEVSH